jgi:hypothetical protein
VCATAIGTVVIAMVTGTCAATGTEAISSLRDTPPRLTQGDQEPKTIRVPRGPTSATASSRWRRRPSSTPTRSRRLGQSISWID